MSAGQIGPTLGNPMDSIAAGNVRRIGRRADKKSRRAASARGAGHRRPVHEVLVCLYAYLNSRERQSVRSVSVDTIYQSGPYLPVFPRALPSTVTVWDLLSIGTTW